MPRDSKEEWCKTKEAKAIIEELKDRIIILERAMCILEEKGLSCTMVKKATKEAENGN